MSPASYLTAPPRGGTTNLAGEQGFPRRFLNLAGDGVESRLQLGEQLTAVAQRAYEAFAQRDREALVELADPEIAIHLVTNLVAGREGPYRGHAGVGEYLDDVTAVRDEIGLQRHRFLELSDERMLVLGRARTRRGTTRIDMPSAWLWEFAGGEVKAVRVLAEPESIASLPTSRELASS
jgi:ketosteroid isomerase-like protein